MRVRSQRYLDRALTGLVEPLESRRLLSAATIYVDQTATGANSGADWADAFTNLQSALSFAVAAGVSDTNPITIDVAEGAYSPGSGASATFQLLGDNSHVVTATGADATALLEGVTISGGSDNDDPDYGGGGLSDMGGAAQIDDCIFQNNFASNGGAVYCTDPAPTFTDCEFLDNSCLQGDFGGAILNIDGSPLVTGCTFIGNSAAGGAYAGGAIYTEGGSPIITNCTFTNDSSNQGGGIFNFMADPTISGCTFTDDGYGEGAVFNLNCFAGTVIGCVFTGNTSTNGGGVYNLESSPTIENCEFIGGTAENGLSSGGGGVENYTNSSPKIVNCEFIDNTGVDGGAIYNVNSSSAKIINCTFTGNSAVSGSAIYSDSTSSAKIANCIFWADSDSQTTEIAGTATVTYSDVDGGYMGTGDLNADPKFLSTANLELTVGSPCIDAGSNAAVPAGVTTDLAGNPRIVGQAVDMGAYEFQPYLWYGLGDGISWNDAANWAADQVPNSSANVIVPTGTVVELPDGVSQSESLTLQGTATLDLRDGTLLIDYGSAADPIASIVLSLTAGYNGGAWNGTGIISSTVAGANSSQSKLVYGVGYADGADGLGVVSSGVIEIMPTLAGDARLQGQVNFGDFELLAAYFGSSGGWDEGNFTYDGSANFGDFELLAQNFGADSSALAASDVQASGISPATVTGTGVELNDLVLIGAAADPILSSDGEPILAESFRFSF
jgi:predicted outer membrane repeat protein